MCIYMRCVIKVATPEIKEEEMEEVKIRINILEVGCKAGNWVNLAQDRIQSQALMLAVSDLTERVALGIDIIKLYLSVKNIKHVTLEIIRTVSMKMTVLWDIVTCCVLEINLRFRSAYSLHHQDGN